jgi:general secretion pathway protein G
MKKLNKKGFTLIELLVVIAIIGLLSTLAVVALNSARQKSRDARRVADVKQIQTALELFYNDCGSYPLQAAATAFSAATSYSNGCSGGVTLGTFMQQIPTNPTPLDNTPTCTDPNGSYYYQSTTAAGTACAASPCASYTIAYCLGGVTGGINAGPHVATPAGIQ